jgi:copper(I)-binding protein
MKNTLLLGLLLILLVSCTAQPQNPISVQNAWARATTDAMPMEQNHNSMGGKTSAIYMVIYNQTNQDDRLIGAKTSIAETVEIHETRMENDIMRMQKVDGVEIPANGKVELKPGGYHIMLINLKQDLKAGEKVPFTLVFEKNGEINLEAEIRTP